MTLPPIARPRGSVPLPDQTRGPVTLHHIRYYPNDSEETLAFTGFVTVKVGRKKLESMVRNDGRGGENLISGDPRVRVAVAEYAASLPDYVSTQGPSWPMNSDFLITLMLHAALDQAEGRTDPKQLNGLGALDKNTLEQWSGKRFRMPDAFDGKSAVWYGPGGADGEHATVATLDGDDVIVWEYTYVVGQIEDPYADYSVQKTVLSFADIEAAVLDAPGGGGFSTNLQVLRWAASLGVAKLAYWGGEESWANVLPR